MIELVLRTTESSDLVKKQIYQVVWKEPENVKSVVFSIIANIRQKLRKVTTKKYIQTVWGVGCKFVDSNNVLIYIHSFLGSNQV